MLHENWYEQQANNNIKTSHAKGKKILALLIREKKLKKSIFLLKDSSHFEILMKDGEEFVEYLSNVDHRRRMQRLCFHPSISPAYISHSPSIKVNEKYNSNNSKRDGFMETFFISTRSKRKSFRLFSLTRMQNASTGSGAETTKERNFDKSFPRLTFWPFEFAPRREEVELSSR